MPKFEHDLFITVLDSKVFLFFHLKYLIKLSLKNMEDQVLLSNVCSLFAIAELLILFREDTSCLLRMVFGLMSQKS
jgi:hypothetical protein